MTTKHKTSAHLAAEKIHQAAPNFKPKIGVVLGSGLGSFASQLQDTVILPYDQLPGFPKVTVHGHGGNLILGYLNGIAVACLEGRAHSYEGCNHETVKTYIRTLRLIGCDHLLLTNASGSLHGDVGPGELMLIRDHINMQPSNPLIGPNDEEFGPRFFPLDNAYDRDLCTKLLKIAQDENISLHQGVYLSVLGPNYETAAEIKAFRILGADAVGMSTVPEVLVANHCGMKVAVVAIITNYATGLAHTSHDHNEVVKMAGLAAGKLTKLIDKLILDLEPS